MSFGLKYTITVSAILLLAFVVWITKGLLGEIANKAACDYRRWQKHPHFVEEDWKKESRGRREGYFDVLSRTLIGESRTQVRASLGMPEMSRVL